ncbi:MAG: hypothetical protein J6P93_00925 [Alphaproteobacteria bacterium]|nr:hypothetical protein [Alphaproteobacteria bacterium]
MIERVIKLSSIVKYTNRESLINAISDQDFKTHHTKMLIENLRKKDKNDALVTFCTLQNEMSVDDLNKISSSLDYNGFMYEHTVKTVEFRPEYTLPNELYRFDEFKPEYMRPKKVGHSHAGCCGGKCKSNGHCNCRH